jgi:hypothetical protein
MDSIVQETKSFSHNSFISHVFSTSEESKAEILNVIQYSLTAIVPVIGLNKTIQKFIPEADVEKSSVELLAEIFMQIVIMFIGIILIHRLITYFPTYSGYKYEQFNLTTVILAFLVIVLSLQTKMGIKVNILSDRLMELWNGPGEDKKAAMRKKNGQQNHMMPNHMSSQADHLDASGMQQGTFPPAPAVASDNRSSGQGFDYMLKVSGTGGQPGPQQYQDFGPAPANSLIGGGASFW